MLIFFHYLELPGDLCVLCQRIPRTHPYYLAKCVCTFASTDIIWLSRRGCVFVPDSWLPRQCTPFLSGPLTFGISFPMKRRQRGRLYSYSLRAGQSGDRIPVVVRLSAPVPTGPGAHPASCTVGTESYPGVKWPRRWPPTPHLTSGLKKE
jgi:hypothetical protein